MEEAWQDALKDGNLSSGEYHKLSKLQKSLGVTDEEVSRISARSAAQTILKRGKAKSDEIEFILSSVAERPQFEDLGEMITKGKITKSVKSRLQDLVEVLELESEEE